MKVDILGRGVVPGLGVLAPVYCKDLTETELERILKQSALKVYLAGTKVAVIKRNLHQLIMQDGGSKPTVQKPIEDKVTPSHTPAKEEPKPVVAVEPETDTAKELVAEVAEVEEPTIKAVVEEVSTSETVLPTPQTSSKKKNRK